MRLPPETGFVMYKISTQHDAKRRAAKKDNRVTELSLDSERTGG